MQKHFVMVILTIVPTLIPTYANECVAQLRQPHSEAVIRQLEASWSQAYWTGDSAFLECLYAPNFQSVESNGTLNSKADDIASARTHVGKTRKSGANGYRQEIFMSPHTAIATNIKGDKAHGFLVTDVYEYNGERWHAIFSQATKY